MPATEGVTW